MTYKICAKCLIEKAVEEFNKNSKNKDGLQAYCRECLRVLKRSPSYRKTANETRKVYTKANPEKRILWSTRKRAQEDNREFNLTLEDIIIPEFCPVLGIPIYSCEGKSTDNSASIDRYDNSKGYVKGNINIISWRANNLKSNGTLEEFKLLVKWLEL